MQDPNQGQLGQIQPVACPQWRSDEYLILLGERHVIKSDRKLLRCADEVDQQVTERDSMAVSMHPDAVHLR